MDSVSLEDTEKPTSENVIVRVAAWKGIDPIELEPLYNVVDPDALDALFTGTTGSGQLSFMYCGCEVIIEDNGQVVVQDPDVDSHSPIDATTSQKE